MSTDVFDPYHKWLGIPPHEQPPTYYRLLGLSPFEQDMDVINRAAEGRMLLLRSVQQGPHLHFSESLLNEVVTAKNCLLNPEFKRRYDYALAGAVPAPVTAPRSYEPESSIAPPPVAAAAEAYEEPSSAYEEPSYYRRPKYRRRVTGGNFSIVMWTLGGIVGSVIGYWIAFNLVGFDPLELFPRDEAKPAVKQPAKAPVKVAPRKRS